MSTWEEVLLEPARTVLSQVGQFLVNILLVLIILVIGWLVAKVVKTAVTRALRIAKLDELSDRIELDALLEKGGITYSLSELIGVIGYWVIMLITFVVAVNAVGLTIAADLLNKIVLYIPNVVVAIFIMIMGIFIATLLKNIVQAAAGNAGLAQAAFLSKLAEIIVIAFAVVVALEELNIGIRITELTLGIILGTIGLALGLSFGLGCKDLAGRFMSDLVEKMKRK